MYSYTAAVTLLQHHFRKTFEKAEKSIELAGVRCVRDRQSRIRRPVEVPVTWQGSKEESGD